MLRFCKALVARLCEKASTNHTAIIPAFYRQNRLSVANLVLDLKHGLYEVWLLVTKNPSHQQTPMNRDLGPTSVADMFLVRIIQANPELHLVLARPAIVHEYFLSSTSIRLEGVVKDILLH